MTILSSPTVDGSHYESVGNVSAAELRQSMQLWVTGVTVITTAWAGQTAGLVSNSFTSVSLEPALVSWCIDLKSSSVDMWRQTDNFAVHVLNSEQRHLVTRFARRGGDKFDGVAWSSGRYGSPILEHSAVSAAPLILECEVWDRYDGGDHLIVVGQVGSLLRPTHFDPLTNHALQS